MNASENLYFTSPPPAHQPPKQTNEGLVEKLCEEVVRYHNLRKKMEKEVAAFRQTKKAACENLRDSKKYLEDLHEIRLKQLQEMKRHNSVMEALKKQEKEAQQENRKTKQRRFSQ